MCVCVILPQSFQLDVRQLWELKSLSVTLSLYHSLCLSISPTEQIWKTNMRITTKIINKTHAVLHINCERIVFWLMICDCLHLCCCFLVRALATLKWWITYWAWAVASNARLINSPNQLMLILIFFSSAHHYGVRWIVISDLKCLALPLVAN